MIRLNPITMGMFSIESFLFCGNIILFNEYPGKNKIQSEPMAYLKYMVISPSLVKNNEAMKFNVLIDVMNQSQ